MADPLFEDVCRELDARRRIDLGFERIEALLGLLGNPEESLRVVQVVGTNGKGTTALALAAALEASGASAGAYLSPHVFSYTERVFSGGGYVSEEDFAAAMGEAIRLADEHGVPATQFELLTAGALGIFRNAGLSWAVLEAGLGARHDATTAARPEAVVLTNVALDHTEYLGETVGEIALEKLASLRRGSALILGTEDPEVVRLAEHECGRVGARLVPVGGELEPVEAPGLPPYGSVNVALGVRAAEALLGRKSGPSARESVVQSVVGALPARFEVLEAAGVPVVVDGGHNPAGLRAALDGVRRRFGDRPVGVVFGCLRDKDIVSMLGALKAEAQALVLARPGGAARGAEDRAADPFWIERAFSPKDRTGRKARVVEEAGEALGAAVEEMREAGGVVLVAGSLYLAASVLERLRGA